MKIIRLSSLLFAFALAASAFWFDVPVLAGNPGQNANSSTTTIENTNTPKPSRGRSRRPKRRAATEGVAVPATELIALVPETEQTDLSGTYTGTFECSDAGVSGETTLTITGNQFTLADGKTGRITAATTHGYTGVAMQFGESSAATPTQPATAPTIVSMRAKKSGDRLTLIPVAESGRVCSFTPAGSSRSRARRTRAARPATVAEPATVAPPAEPAATPATPAEPATPGADAGPTPPAAPATPASRRRGRRGRSNPNPNPNTNTGDDTGNPNAKPTPTPAVPRN